MGAKYAGVPVDRREFLRSAALWGAGAAASASGLSACKGRGLPPAPSGAARTSFAFEEATLGDLGRSMQAGALTAERLAQAYLDRIRELNPALLAVIEVDPDALGAAAALDRERRARGPRGPLHGIAVLLKDNVDTADRTSTTAGSLALAGVRRRRDAFVAARLRGAGCVLLGKANMSEWANFRGKNSSSGWSARGGQGRNPYALDRSPGGSSSGSAQAVAANLVAVAIGTETDGSIVAPASLCGVVGLKPTVGATSRRGVIPIAHSQDTVGPLARTVEDAARVLVAIAGPDPEDPATAAQAGLGEALGTALGTLDRDGLRGARIGVAREGGFFGYSRSADAIAEEAIRALRSAGAEVVDPADLPTARALAASEESELEVLHTEFKADLDAYLGALGPEARVRSIADLVAFDEAHADVELRFFGHEHLVTALGKGPLTNPTYRAALERNRRLAGREGIDAVMDRHRLDALVAPTTHPAFPIDLVNGDHWLGGASTAPALAGYPALTVPAGHASGLPVGLLFFGRAFSEPTLVRLAYAFEQLTRARRPPGLAPTVEPPPRG